MWHSGHFSTSIKPERGGGGGGGGGLGSPSPLPRLLLPSKVAHPTQTLLGLTGTICWEEGACCLR